MNKVIKKLNKKEQERLEKQRVYMCKYRKINPKKISIARCKWQKANPEKVNANSRKSYKAHRMERIASNRKWAKANPKKQKAYIYKYIATNINARIAKNLRTRLWDALFSQVAHKQGHLKDLIGTTISNLRFFLEKQFTIGMSWQNYGQWHIDHVKPLSSFDLTKLSEQKKAMSYINLQPLWAKDNLSKGCREIINVSRK